MGRGACVGRGVATVNALVEAAGILNDMWSVTVGWLQHSGSNSTVAQGAVAGPKSH